ncbi:hypothetical protein [Thermogymnomonas acidicola]|uniref:hypothetical protein n=1 Tax=Thermogymnomonas acidicola TaxID=399579 RepID=UPI0009463DF2|nr:hypothetical protein [Thermogymnomonas acidicola]
MVEFLVRAGRYRYYLSGRVSSEIQEIMEQIPGQVSRVISEHLGDRRLVDAVRRLQQLCVSCHAKSVEDMAFYRYTPLISICEVGHDPSHPASSHEEFTRFIEGRSRWPPLSMNATSTHDTKLGEDLRWRVTAISYFADEYTAHLSGMQGRSLTLGPST